MLPDGWSAIKKPAILFPKKSLTIGLLIFGDNSAEILRKYIENAETFRNMLQQFEYSVMRLKSENWNSSAKFFDEVRYSCNQR
ncbi:MAG: hypothetical protein LBI18_09180 [Planctomycetaceae bacterium]|nr:hypothetical protein [Planctomycetaceae bacterium]